LGRRATSRDGRLWPIAYYDAPADPAALPTPHQLEESRAKLADCECPHQAVGAREGGLVQCG